MTQFVTWLTSVMSITFAQIDGVDVTLGLVVAVTLIFGFAVNVIGRIKSRS